MTAFALTPGLWLIIDTLAVFRISRFVTADILTEKPRARLAANSHFGWYDFLSCSWCVSIWIAAAVVLLTVFAPNEWKYVAYLLTCSAVAGNLSERR